MVDWQPMMLGPITVFAFVVATLIGSIFHFVFGGDARRLALFLLAAWVGFAMGHAAGNAFDVPFFEPIGNLNIVTAIIGALFTLFSVLIFTSGRRTPARTARARRQNRT